MQGVATALRVEGTSVAILPVPFDAPWLWLAAGCRARSRRPAHSPVYRSVFAALSILLTLLRAVARIQALVPPLAGGVILAAPLAAVGHLAI